MEFSALPSTSYSRSVTATSSGRQRREGTGHAFQSLQREVASPEAEVTGDKRHLPALASEAHSAESYSAEALTRWLRFMGSLRTEGRTADEDHQPVDTVRYRLQRAYYDQEPDREPPPSQRPDQRLQTYQAIERSPAVARFELVV